MSVTKGSKTNIHKVTKTIVSAPDIYKPVGPYSQAILADKTLYVSGVLGMDPQAQLVCGGAEAQARQALDNLKHILEAGGASLESVVKTTILLGNMDDFQIINQVYAEYKTLSFSQSVEETKQSGQETEMETFAMDRNEIKVLPTCDNLGDCIQLASNNKYSDVDTSLVDLEKDTDNDLKTSEKTEEKLSTLEEVVEKVVALYGADEKMETEPKHKTVLYKKDEVHDEAAATGCDVSDTTESEQKDLKESSIVENNLGHSPNKSDTNLIVSDSPNKSDMNLSHNPSESDTNRATRWEALADIAAELPPLLTVDPNTGQIYAVSK